MREFLAAFALGAFLAATHPAGAADMRTLPVPAVTIYPGDTIRDAQLTERGFPSTYPGAAAAIDGRSLLVGKVARRTLLPGKPVASRAVGEASVVTRSAPVRLVYQTGGLTITATAAALQDGAVGEVIRVRNIDSGVVLAGIVMADGSVRVGTP